MPSSYHGSQAFDDQGPDSLSISSPTTFSPLYLLPSRLPPSGMRATHAEVLPIPSNGP